MAKVYVRFEYGVEDRISEEYGPYLFVQITYDILRDEDGEHIARMDRDELWKPFDSTEKYSDVTITPAE